MNHCKLLTESDEHGGNRKMIYYQDEELVIRNMEEGDARVFYEEYLAQGWHPDLSVYTQRLKDQAEGKCIALTAVYRGHPAGSV